MQSIINKHGSVMSKMTSKIEQREEDSQGNAEQGSDLVENNKDIAQSRLSNSN